MINKHTPCAFVATAILLAACAPAPNDNIPVPTTANTNAVNTVAAATATAKAEPTATQPAPTATPLPTATIAPTLTPSPAPTSIPVDAPPWAGKLKRIPGATDPDGFVYEVPPEALAGIEDWVKRYQQYVDRTNSSPQSLFSVGQKELANVLADPLLSRVIRNRNESESLWLSNAKLDLDSVRGMAANGDVLIVIVDKPVGLAVRISRNGHKEVEQKSFPMAKVLMKLSIGADGVWRKTEDRGQVD
jgi:hypothetical protein